MIFGDDEHVAALHDLDDVHGELDCQEEDTVRSVGQCSSDYFTEHLLLHEKFHALSSVAKHRFVALL